MLLQKRNALVTGGASGIGRGIALRFADEGCSVAVCDINLEEAEKTAAEAKKRGAPNAIALRCDVTNSGQVRDTVEKVIAEFSGLDILVNNAGALIPSPPIEDTPEEDWDKMLTLNLKSNFLFSKYALPHMKSKKYGKIIGISSIGAISPPAHSAHYNAAKAGVIGFCKDLARELAQFNICVNAILPGPIRSPFYKDMTEGMSPDEVDNFFETLGKAAVPMGRIGVPEEIGGAAVFFASDLSSYVTGQELVVGGGLPLVPHSPMPL